MLLASLVLDNHYWGLHIPLDSQATDYNTPAWFTKRSPSLHFLDPVSDPGLPHMAVQAVHRSAPIGTAHPVVFVIGAP